MEITNNFKEYQQKFIQFKDKYERFFPAAFFVLGFSFDLITLGEIDDLSNIISQAIYLLISGHILFLYFHPLNPNDQNKFLNYYIEYKDDLFHFLLGSLLSAFTIFYFKSSSFANSFIFLIFIAILLIANETKLFQKLGQLIKAALYMLCLVSYLIYIVPIIFGKTGLIYFLLSALIAFCFSILKGYILHVNKLDKNLIIKQLVVPQIIVLLIFNILYLTKIIPPVPLSIKHIGIYHKVEKENGDYITYSNKKWYNFWSNGDQNFNAQPNDRVYVFAKVFAPAGFEGKVFIHWLKDTKDGWKTSDRIPLEITGGRREGFRGYAYKSNYTKGDWQVRIETANGLEIGRINLEILKNDNSVERKFKMVRR